MEYALQELIKNILAIIERGDIMVYEFERIAIQNAVHEFCEKIKEEIVITIPPGNGNG